jgi:hypothetical protein
MGNRPPQGENPVLPKHQEKAEWEDAIYDVTALTAASSEITSLIGCLSADDCAQVILQKSSNASKTVVAANFPGALPGDQILAMVAAVVEKRGYTESNTLFAQSVCPDEINHEEGDITNILTKYLGEVFHLGGLAGVPFTGKTGFGAFSHHVPDDGHCFVLMAPHIGLDNESNLGKYTRDGQLGCSAAACGAAGGALNHCCSGLPLPDMAACPEDYQMSFLMHEIAKRMDVILASKDENTKQAQLARQTHEISKSMLDKIVNVNFGGSNSTLVILSGIQINMPRPLDDYFQPLHFYVISKDGQHTSLFEEAFGHASA